MTWTKLIEQRPALDPAAEGGGMSGDTITVPVTVEVPRALIETAVAAGVRAAFEAPSVSRFDARREGEAYLSVRHQGEAAAAALVRSGEWPERVRATVEAEAERIVRAVAAEELRRRAKRVVAGLSDAALARVLAESEG